MINTIRLETIDDVRKILFDQEFKPDIGRHRNLFVYRGLPDPNYELKTSLQRFCKNKRKEIESVLLDNFHIAIKDYYCMCSKLAAIIAE